MVELEVLGLVGIFVAVGLFFIGFIVGKQSDDKMLKNMAKAFQIDRELDGRTKGNPKIFVDKGELRGTREISVSFQAKCDIVDFEKKKKYTEEGTIDLTDADIAELRKLPQFRKTAI